MTMYYLLSTSVIAVCPVPQQGAGVTRGGVVSREKNIFYSAEKIKPAY
jgi:hypothetical protein